MMVLLFLYAIIFQCHAFSSHRVSSPRNQIRNIRLKSLAIDSTTETRCTSIFNFAKNETLDQFERIDDVIMGGISSSSFRDVPGEEYASWSGICRVDGGGFCGTRTKAFKEPLDVGNAEGFYIDCRLASDDEPNRRTWKMSTRTEKSRGEELYQTDFQIKSGKEEWNRVFLPFEDFQKVRGPRLVQNASKIDTSSGIYQVGLTMSKFTMARNVTEVSSFRPGYFELQIKNIGLFTSQDKTIDILTPKTLTDSEMKKNKSPVAKILFPLLRILFSEKARRRNAAMKILREKRGLSRRQAIIYSIKARSLNRGLLLSTLRAARVIAVDTLRALLGKTLTFIFFSPFILINRVKRTLNRRKKKGTVSAEM